MLSQRRWITETLEQTYTGFGISKTIPEDLFADLNGCNQADAIRCINDAFAKVPSNAKNARLVGFLETTPYNTGQDVEARIRICYERPETDEEYQARLCEKT